MATDSGPDNQKETGAGRSLAEDKEILWAVS